MESNPPQKSKPKPDTRMLVGRWLRADLGWKTRKRVRAALAVRDHDWKVKNQAEEDTRKGKRHLHSKKQMVQNDRQVLARHVRHPG